jgi:tRNA pseudouridine synthase 10
MGWHKKPKRFHTFEEFSLDSLTNSLEDLSDEQVSNLQETLFVLIEQLSKGREFKTFLLSISWPPIHPETKATLRKSLHYSLTKQIQEKLGVEPDFHGVGAEFLIDFVKKRVFLSLSPVFIKGNYCKFSRKIAQTDYFCPKCKGRGIKSNQQCEHCKGTGRVTEESLADLLSVFFIKKFHALDYIFHGAGREDSDVRMLGKGRPFIIEIIQPEIRASDLNLLESEINSNADDKFSVNSLQFVTSKDVAPLKNNSHDKIYSAIVSCSPEPVLSKLVFGEKIKVLQRTPERVSKRRSDLVRTKFVKLIETEDNKDSENKNEFVLKLRTSHGTYVKEFISGDGERTNPSLSSILGIKCFCKQLDVLEICEENEF